DSTPTRSWKTEALRDQAASRFPGPRSRAESLEVTFPLDDRDLHVGRAEVLRVGAGLSHRHHGVALAMDETNRHRGRGEVQWCRPAVRVEGCDRAVSETGVDGGDQVEYPADPHHQRDPIGPLVECVESEVHTRRVADH